MLGSALRTWVARSPRFIYIYIYIYIYIISINTKHGDVDAGLCPADIGGPVPPYLLLYNYVII